MRVLSEFLEEVQSLVCQLNDQGHREKFLRVDLQYLDTAVGATQNKDPAYRGVKEVEL